MAVINDLGFPFTSVGGDRQYSSSEWREYFNALVEGGIVGGIGNELEVKPQAIPNKTIFIDTGSILIEGAMRSIETTVDLSFADNTSGSTRIDRVVARINYNDRKIEFVVKEGTTVAPTLTRDSSFYEMSLAKVTLANGYSTITATEITDERPDEDLCGFHTWMALEAHKDKIASQTVLGHVKAPEKWIKATLLNGWVDYSSSTGVFYKKNDFGLVSVVGKMTSGTLSNGTSIFRLPEGYRPSIEMGVLASMLPGDFFKMMLNPDGYLNVFTSGQQSGTIWINFTFSMEEVE